MIDSMEGHSILVHIKFRTQLIFIRLKSSHYFFKKMLLLLCIFKNQITQKILFFQNYESIITIYHDNFRKRMSRIFT
jgi:hypothetical protein